MPARGMGREDKGKLLTSLSTDATPEIQHKTARSLLHPLLNGKYGCRQPGQCFACRFPTLARAARTSEFPKEPCNRHTKNNSFALAPGLESFIWGAATDRCSKEREPPSKEAWVTCSKQHPLVPLLLTYQPRCSRRSAQRGWIQSVCFGWFPSQCSLHCWAPGSGKQEVWGSRDSVTALCSPSAKAESLSYQNSPSRKRKDCCQTREKEKRNRRNQSASAENIRLAPPLYKLGNGPLYSSRSRIS